MNANFFKAITWSAALWLCAFSTNVFAAAPSAALSDAQKKAQAQGFIFETSHTDIVAKAKAEGKVRVLSSFDPDNYKVLAEAFKKKYPFIEVEVQELTGTAANERFLLELKAGTVSEWDAYQLSSDNYNALTAFAKKFDILGMAQSGVLAVPVGMIDPRNRNVVAEGSALSAVAYNKKLLDPEKVPNTWEDFLKPQFKGRKFMVDIRPQGFSALAAGMGEEWMKNYARKLKGQEPIWARGHTRALTSIIAGEYGLHQLTNYHSCVRAMEKDRTGSLVCKVIEPVPVRLIEPEGVMMTSTRPYAALLWLEFQATPEGQRIVDEHEPLKSSVFAPNSALQKITNGKKLAVNGWDTWHNTPKWMKMAIEAFGFPKASRRK